MDAARFRNSPVGEVVPISFTDVRLNRTVNHWAFKAKALPSDPTFRPATYKLIGEAERELGRLDAHVGRLPNPDLLVRPSLQREALSTSALEGTYAPVVDVLAADHIDDRKKSAEVREVQNYFVAAMMGLDLIKRYPICFSVAAKVQKRLVSRTRGDKFDSGRMREQIVAIGDRGGEIESARFVPMPPGQDLEDGIAAWETWLHADDDIPFIARLALGHYQFETLHPFSDGNGRIGRLLLSLQLVEGEVLHHPVMNLSSWLEPRRQDYIDHLLQVSEDGNYDSWVAFFARGIRDQAIASSRRVTRLTQVQDQLVTRVLEANRKGVIVELARDLIGNPLLSVKDVQKRYDITQPSARSVVQHLEDLGILHEITGANWGRVYVCEDVYDALMLDS
jgi:Fic family protein